MERASVERRLVATRVDKAFDGVQALADVSFELRAGEVHALVGENGAGKSTLIRIITGAETPDAGTLSIDGQTLRRLDPALGRRLGIAAIHQQPALFPHLTVAENIAWAGERGSLWRRVDWRARHRLAGAVLARAGASIDPGRLADSLSVPEQQLVEIAKAIAVSARIVVMDEPTAALTEPEARQLFQTIARLLVDGVGIIYVSHRLDEVLSLAHRITVLRDGKVVARVDRDECDRTRLIQLMVGRALESATPKTATRMGDVGLELRAVSCRAGGVHDVSLAVRRGEVFGIAGLVGSGRTELARTIFGLTPADAGEILVRGVPVRIASPSDAVAHGIAYAPEDRRQHGVLPSQSIVANLTLASLAEVSRGGLIDARREREVSARFVTRLGVKCSSIDAAVGTLSGGNQQKVALARWLATRPHVLVLDEPTQGVDVGAKAEIHTLIQSLAADGLAVVLISSELPELLKLSDRIAVMRAGSIARVLDRNEADQETVMAIAVDEAPAMSGR
jgi:rhamnose transport system ATP-binding protein